MSIMDLSLKQGRKFHRFTVRWKKRERYRLLKKFCERIIINLALHIKVKPRGLPSVSITPKSMT